MSDVRQVMIDVLDQHSRRTDPNHPGWPKCRCGFDPEATDEGDTWAEHVTDYLLDTFRAMGVGTVDLTVSPLRRLHNNPAVTHAVNVLRDHAVTPDQYNQLAEMLRFGPGDRVKEGDRLGTVIYLSGCQAAVVDWDDEPGDNEGEMVRLDILERV